MSLLVRAMTSEDDAEIMESLQCVRNSSRMGLVHESINVNRNTEYTRKSARLAMTSGANKLTKNRKLVCLGKFSVCAGDSRRCTSQASSDFQQKHCPVYIVI